MEKVVHIIMGAIGTGKSYLADILAKQNGISILSADQIEFENKDLKEQDIEGQIVEDYLNCLDNNESFILDGLNLNRSTRQLYINQAKSSGFKVYVYDLGPGNNLSLERRLKEHRGIASQRWRDIAKANRDNYEKPSTEREAIDKLYTLY